MDNVGSAPKLKFWVEESEMLRKERDDARAATVSLALELASMRSVLPSYDLAARKQKELDEARTEIARLGAYWEEKFLTVCKERDEARRFACMMAAGKEGKSSSASPDAIAYAQERGWDCFKNEAKS